MTDDTFGAWLRVQIKRRGLTQTEFAERAGTVQSVVSRWIRGERLPDTDSCDRIADALGVHIDEVLVRASHRPDINGDPPVVRDLVSRVRRIQWDEQRAAMVLAMFDALLDHDRRSGHV